MLLERKPMEIKSLGKCGLKISSLCLGTMTFGAGADEIESFRIMDSFYEKGHFFFDTADIYNEGISEEIVGKWISERNLREKIILATKVYGKTGDEPNDGGLSRYHIIRGVENSLRRLKTDYIDLYQIHRWDSGVPVQETADVLSALVDAGKVRYLGCSNLKAWHLSEYLNYAETAGKESFVSIQPVYNALNRGIEGELLDFAAEKGIGVIPYNPLAGGMLTGKYRRGEPIPESSRLKEMEFYRDRYYTQGAFEIIEPFTAMARERGITPAQLALAWVMREPKITAPIIGARTVDQLMDTMEGEGIVLTPEERESIPAVRPCFWVGKDPVYDRGRQ
jgi:aryl-alcohol dehydrogenase-like predicted oxidoreductase